MIDPYVDIRLTPKQLHVLMEAAESKIKWLDAQVAEAGETYDGEDIDGWDVNDTPLLASTLE